MEEDVPLLGHFGRSLSSLFTQCASPGRVVVLSIDDITNGDGEFLLDDSKRGEHRTTHFFLIIIIIVMSYSCILGGTSRIRHSSDDDDHRRWLFEANRKTGMRARMLLPSRMLTLYLLFLRNSKILLFHLWKRSEEKNPHVNNHHRSWWSKNIFPLSGVISLWSVWLDSPPSLSFSFFGTSTRQSNMEKGQREKEDNKN